MYAAGLAHRTRVVVIKRPQSPWVHQYVVERVKINVLWRKIHHRDRRMPRPRRVRGEALRKEEPVPAVPRGEKCKRASDVRL